MTEDALSQPSPEPLRRRRRPRYAGKHPRRFAEKYKEHAPEQYAEAVAKILASGKTPAGTHRPIMVAEIMAVLEPRPGEIAVDSTLGYGGHARELLSRLQPGGRLLGLDVDPIELAKTESRLQGLEGFTAHRGSFAALAQLLAEQGIPGVDIILADLGASSMQLDNPERGFSFKHEGPLDMRMNPGRSQTAAGLLRRIKAGPLAALLSDNADEPNASLLGEALAGRDFVSTTALASAIRAALARLNQVDRDQAVRRVFQALRIAVNDEFSALDTFLRQVPDCLRPGGRVAILTFHSGEDQRVKRSFVAGLRAGVYAEIAREIQRPSAAECHANPRSVAAKLRWAIRQ